MRKEHLDALMKEYDLVNAHWTLATQQKAVVIQICGTIIVALLGARFLGHLSWGQFSAVALAIAILATFVYAQKEADYWAAAICLESIERVVNRTQGVALLGYVQNFKDILFQRHDRVSRSPVRVMHLLRIGLGLGLVVLCCIAIVDEYGALAAWVYAVLAVIALLHIAYSSQYTMRKAQLALQARLAAIDTDTVRQPDPEIERSSDPPTSM